MAVWAESGESRNRAGSVHRPVLCACGANVLEVSGPRTFPSSKRDICTLWGSLVVPWLAADSLPLLVPHEPCRVTL